MSSKFATLEDKFSFTVYFFPYSYKGHYFYNQYLPMDNEFAPQIIRYTNEFENLKFE
jgi:hypothetical protein